VLERVNMLVYLVLIVFSPCNDGTVCTLVLVAVAIMTSGGSAVRTAAAAVAGVPEARADADSE
jgi:hypothetical protein